MTVVKVGDRLDIEDNNVVDIGSAPSAKKKDVVADQVTTIDFENIGGKTLVRREGELVVSDAVKDSANTAQPILSNVSNNAVLHDEFSGISNRRETGGTYPIDPLAQNLNGADEENEGDRCGVSESTQSATYDPDYATNHPEAHSQRRKSQELLSFLNGCNQRY